MSFAINCMERGDLFHRSSNLLQIVLVKVVGSIIVGFKFQILSEIIFELGLTGGGPFPTVVAKRSRA